MFYHFAMADRASQRCTLCQEIKPLSEFHRRGIGYMRWCKPCRARYDADHYPLVKDRRAAQVRARGLAASAVIRELKMRPCSDCGGTFHPAAMTFDHLPGAAKHSDVASMARRHSISRIKQEIAKCELVCANCHAVRTYERREASRQTAA
jgi:hypothetical protein